MCEVLGLEFYRNVIDVHIVSGNPRQFSRPLVIKSGYQPKEFVDVLTHELTHVLLSDNHDILKLIPSSAELYPNETALTQNHIIVHAVLKYLYLDVLQDQEKLDNNLAVSKKHSTPDYARAWQIVEEVGYMKIISDFKDKIKAVGS